MKKKYLSVFTLLLLAGIIFFHFSAVAAAEQPLDPGEKPLRQEEFAVELVKLLDIQDLLPPAALASDCVNLLEKIGIAPLQGWNNKALLQREDYLTVIAKAQGKEGMVHRRAAEVEEKNIEIINKKWQESYSDEGRWISLSELLHNKKYFPQGPLKSPYGTLYRDKNGDHKVDPILSPVIKLMR